MYGIITWFDDGSHDDLLLVNNSNGLAMAHAIINPLFIAFASLAPPIVKLEKLVAHIE